MLVLHKAAVDMQSIFRACVQHKVVDKSVSSTTVWEPLATAPADVSVMSAAYQITDGSTWSHVFRIHSTTRLVARLSDSECRHGRQRRRA